MDVSSIEEELLTCELCEERVFIAERNLSILPCQHTLCSTCIKGMITKRKKNESLKCPWCRNDFRLDSNNKLPKFRYAARLCELVKFSSPKEQRQDKNDKDTKEPLLVAQLDLAEVMPRNKTTLWGWGENGKLYLVDETTPGLSYLDVTGDRMLHTFGNLQSFYTTLLYKFSKLYALNSCRNVIEVYKDDVCVDSWSLCILHQPPQRKMYARLISIRNGILLHYQVAYRDGVYRYLLASFNEAGKPSLVFLTDKEKRYDKLLWYRRKLSECNDSVWVIDYDKYLWEMQFSYLPEEEITAAGIPRRHFKIPNFLVGSNLGMDNIAYCANDEPAVIRVMELSGLSFHPKADKQRRHLNPQKQENGRKLLDTSGVISGKIMDIVTSDDRGLLAVLDSENIVTVYQTDRRTAKHLVAKSISCTPGPEYLGWRETVTQKYLEMKEQTQQYWRKITGDIVGSFIVLLLLSYLVSLLTRSNPLENIMNQLCSRSEIRQHTYGWRNLHLTFCDDSVLRLPKAYCPTG